MDRWRAIAKQLSAGVGHLLKKSRIPVVTGSATLVGDGRVALTTGDGTREIGAANIVLATGARARAPPGLEADGRRVWDYRTALLPPHMPNDLLLIGAGAIGMEFASFYATLGARTTVMEVMDRILPAVDPEIPAFERNRFEKQGFANLEQAMVRKLDRREDRISATIEPSGTTATRDFDTVISAVGIVGNVENLGLEALGVRIEGSHVVTDELCRTGVDGFYVDRGCRRRALAGAQGQP